MKHGKKRFFSFLVAVQILLQMTSVSVWAYPAPSYGAQDSMSKFANAEPMSVSHRAAWCMAPENSLLAIASSIEMGIDVVELDVKLTSDGVVVLSHDETIDRCVAGSSGNVSEYSWAELAQMSLEPEKGGTETVYTISEEQAALLNSLPDYIAHCGTAVAGDGLSLARMDDAIDLIKQYGANTMINLDHCFSEELFVACYSLLRENDMLGQVFIKGSETVATMNNWYVAAAENWNANHAQDQITAEEVQNSILYVYVIGSENYSLLQQHLDNGDNLVMAEIVIADEVNDAKIKESLEPWCLQNNIAMFVNTMWHGLCSSKDDSETTWAEMLDRGYTAIQTDHASEFVGYMYDYERQRDSIETIQAEHFHLFNYDSYTFQVPIAADENLNKQVTGMSSGDWLSYQNIIFDGNENLLNVNCKGQGNDAVLNFYLDEMVESNQIASVKLEVADDYGDVYSLVMRDIEAGTHTLYVQANGTGTVSLDDFSFVRSASLNGNADIGAVNVVTRIGVAPVLPQTVEVTIDGNSYNFQVSWEQISSEKYASEGEFEVLGYISVLKSYTKALVTVHALTSDIIEDEHLALWLDASSGITVDGNAVTSWASRVGDVVATVNTGSPTVVNNAIGNQAGIRFDGDDIMELTMPDDFWNDKSEFTVLLFNAPESTTNGSNNGTSVSTTKSQDYSILYFYETASWGSALFTASQNEVLFRFGSGVSADYGTSYVREANIGSTYTSTAIRKDGINNDVFVDGELVFAGTGQSYTTSKIGSYGQIGYGKKGTNYKGTICQILVYDRALTDDEIVAAQQWMAEKYYDEIAAVQQVSVTCEAGTVPILPETVQVTYASGATADMGVTWEILNPNHYLTSGVYELNGKLGNGTAILASVTVTEKEVIEVDKGNVVTDGMMFWLDAGEGVTTDENETVTGWKSKVGDFTAVTRKGSVKLNTAVVNGKAGLVFDGTGSLEMQLASDALNGLTGCTVIVYGASHSAIDDFSFSQTLSWYGQRRTLLYANETKWDSSFYVGTYKNAISARFGTFSNKNYGFAAYRDAVTTDFSTTAVRWDASAEQNNYEIEVNGEWFGNADSVGSETKYNADLLYIGEGKNDYLWSGVACEILLYDRALTDEELEDIYSYLTYKYETEDPNAVWDIYLKEEGQELTTYQGTTLSLNAEVVPFYASNLGLLWKSSNPAVATVDENGNVTALGTGQTTITVTTVMGGFSVSCTLRVIKPQNDSVWRDIQNMKEWAENQAAGSYRNWEIMEKSLIGAESISQDSSLESLLEVYQTLRSAMLALEKKPAPMDYGFAEGSENQSITEGTSLTVDVEPDSPYFIGISVDGKTVDAENYVIADDIVITLKAEFISSLSIGTHRLSVFFENGSAETAFTIVSKQDDTKQDDTKPGDEKPENTKPEDTKTVVAKAEITSQTAPATGDEASIMEVVILLCLSIVGLVIVFISRKRRNI